MNIKRDSHPKKKKNKIQGLYQELKKKYGPPKGQWLLWCKRPKTKNEREQVAIGAVLTQRTNWHNVEKSLRSLKKSGVNSLRKIYQIKKKKMMSLVKPSGFYRVKADYLFHLAGFIFKHYGGLEKMKQEDFRRLREELLELKGLGQETVDSILLYVLDKPVFVIDEYTRRLVKKRKLTNNLNYAFLQKFFEQKLKKDFRLYQDFHALIVIDGKNKNGN